MAELSCDFTNDQSRFEALIIQRGRQALDGELNDMQRIARVRAYRSASVMDNDDAKRIGFFGRPRCNNIEIVPGPGNDEVTIQPLSKGGANYGIIMFRGYTFEITSAITLSGLLDVPAAGGSEWQQIYFTIVEQEISAAMDPSIQVAQLGETARRTQLVVTFALGAIDTDEASTFNTLEEPWEGGTKAAVLAVVNRYESGAGNALPLTAAHIQTLWRPPQSTVRFQDRNIFLGPKTVGEVACAGWDYTSHEVSFVNVAVWLPWVENTSTGPSAGMPLAIDLPTGPIELPNMGDVLWLVIDRGKPGIGANVSSIPAELSATFPVLPSVATSQSARLVVLPMSEVENGIPTDTPDENLEERYWICFRATGSAIGNFDDHVIFRNGMALGTNDVSDTSSTGPDGQTAVAYLAQGDDTLDITKIGIDTPADDKDELPRFRDRYIPTTGGMKLLFACHGPDLGNGHQLMRMYYANEFNTRDFVGWILTSNARWDNGTNQWEADDVDEPSAGLRVGNDGAIGLGMFGVSSRDGGSASPWADNEWPLGSDVAENVWEMVGSWLSGADLTSSYIQNFRNIQLTGTSDPSGVATTYSRNTLHAANIPKAWGVVTAAGGVIGLLDSYGLDGTPIEASGLIRITLDRPMASSNYSVLVTSIGASSSGNSYVVLPLSSTEFDVRGFLPAGGLAMDYSSDDDSFSFVVFGRHA